MKCANEQINRHNFMHSVQRIYKNMVTWITLMRKSNNTFRTPLTKKKKKKKKKCLKKSLWGPPPPRMGSELLSLLRTE